MPRFVIDANYAEDAELDRWLAKSTSNMVLVTSAFAMETYRRKDPSGIRKSYQILARYPKQLLVVKDLIELCRMHTKPKRMAARMIDVEGTKDIQDLCRQIVRRSDAEVSMAVADLVSQASEQLSKLELDSRGIGTELAQDLASLDGKDLHAFRTGKPYNDALIRHLLSRVMGTTIEVIKEIPGCFVPARPEELIFCFHCRLVLCGALALRARARNGNIESVRVDRLRNDLVDAQYMAVALHFDGLLTKDERMRSAFFEAKTIVDMLSYHAKPN